MSIKIYQAFYRDDQLSELDLEFTPYDNRANPIEHIYEHYLYHQTRKLSLADNIERWGTFSWQWKRKLPGPTAADIINYVNSHPEADVVIFNAWPENESFSYNVWEQGEWCHPGILELGYAVMGAMGEDPLLIEAPMTHTNYVLANYFVGNQKFWDGLLDFLDRYVNCIKWLGPEHQKLISSSAGYPYTHKLDFTGFICERLISTYLVKEQDNLTIVPWGTPHDAFSNAKLIAVEEQSKELMHEWNNHRVTPGGATKIATPWIENAF